MQECFLSVRPPTLHGLSVFLTQTKQLYPRDNKMVEIDIYIKEENYKAGYRDDLTKRNSQAPIKIQNDLRHGYNPMQT